MGHTAAVLLDSIMLAPPMLLVAGLLLLLARRLGIVPGGFGAVPGFLLLFCGGYGLLYLGITADMLAVAPARLQTRYIGDAIAGPFSLVYFERGGFQDPYSVWRYRLPARQAAALRRRCQWEELPDGRRLCRLYRDMDERWFAEVILEGDELRMIDGLH